QVLLKDYLPSEIVKHQFYKSKVQSREKNVQSMLDLALNCYTWITPASVLWPKQLARLGRCEPIGLWLSGEARLTQRISIAFTGTRFCSRYGVEVARKLASKISATTINVIAGGAIGIERAAHQGAMLTNGKTIAILAGGLTHFYPRTNTRMLQRIENQGLLMSEVAPWRRARPNWFLTRNRLIVGMSEALVVVEASERSGAMSCVTYANTIGIEVCAVPGSIHSSASVGCHSLIRDGAALVTSAEDIVRIVLPTLESQRIQAQFTCEPSI
ncbi:MAG: DNA-processing protein DprA, partial [Candidatus Nanopelagicales bacterium]